MTRVVRVTVHRRLAFTLAFLVVISGILLLVASYFLVSANLNNPSITIRTVPPTSQGTGATGGTTGGATGATASGTTHPPSAIEISKNLVHKTLSTLVEQYGIILLILVLITSLVAWLVAGRVLRPLRAITSAAQRLTSENLSDRLALEGPDDELKELGDTFDSMIGRLETSFQDQQLFAANAAHELRTPLAVMMAEIDLLLTSKELTVLEAHDAAVRLRRTLTTSERIVERLLILAQSDYVTRERAVVRLDDVARSEIEERRASMAEHNLAFQEDLSAANVLGDPQLLRELIGNLLDNAIKYNRLHGWIDVATRVQNDDAILAVTNSGQDLNSEDLNSLLQPFRRAGRARVGDSTGLGLSIVHNIARVHGGHLTLRALLDGGLEVRVTFPQSADVVERRGDSVMDR